MISLHGVFAFYLVDKAKTLVFIFSEANRRWLCGCATVAQSSMAVHEAFGSSMMTFEYTDLGPFNVSNIVRSLGALFCPCGRFILRAQLSLTFSQPGRQLVNCLLALPQLSLQLVDLPQ